VLTDKQRKKIIADYIQCGNYSQVARKHGISVTYVKKLVTKDKDSVNRFKQKKEENTRDILQYLDSRKIKIQGILDTIIDSITEEEIKKASLTSRTTVFGTLIDKCVIPYTNKITKVDDEHYEENKEALRDKLVKELGNNNDKV
jgi:predicted transcriptional regulator